MTVTTARLTTVRCPRRQLNAADPRLMTTDGSTTHDPSFGNVQPVSSALFVAIDLLEGRTYSYACV